MYVYLDLNLDRMLRLLNSKIAQNWIKIAQNSIKIARISIVPPRPTTIGRSSIDFAQICFKFWVHKCSKFDNNCSNFDLAHSADHNWSKFDRLCTNLLHIFSKFQQILAN